MKRIHLSKKQRIICAGIALLLVGGVAFFFLRQADEPAQPTPPAIYYSQLTGQEVSEEASNRPLLGVMIENSEEARPQTGLDEAGIVFEATTEGGITRYMALYQENMPTEVGPVRSIRQHFVTWAMGFDASIAHVGGSADALALVDSQNAKSLNQFYFPEPYYRSDSRAAPHNMYAKTEVLRQLQADEDHKKSVITGFPRSSDTPIEKPNATKITIDFSSPRFLAEFRYNAETNSYTRHLAGVPHIDTVTKKPITVKNLVVLRTKGQQATGKGDAYVFKDGTVTKVRWQQTNYEERIEFVDAEDNEISLNRGDTWIAMLATDRTLSY